MGLCEQYASIWPATEQDTSQAVCHAESSGNPTAFGDGGDSVGLWQVDTRYHPQYPKSSLTDPAFNAQAALAIWRASGWTAWSTFNNGAYRAFVTGAPVASTNLLSAGPAVPSAGLLLVAAAAAYWLLTS
jgi:hypothetical protein